MKKTSLKLKLISFFLCFLALFPLLPSPVAQAALYDSEKIASPYAAVYNVENGTFIFEKGADEFICPSATAKLMTAVLALEFFPDLSVSINATKE
jgi:D-alanyl-D-alanine carboxypeptidase